MPKGIVCRRLLLAVLGTLATGSVRGAEGQATAKPGAKLSQLDAGTILLRGGGDFDAKAHLGKVVVVNIGGA